ncbi:MAG: hypothetical protein ACI4CZ_01480 [Hominisplanchenecus sp.]
MGFAFDGYSVSKEVLKGSFGLEKESLRVDGEGFLAHTEHPFPDDPNRDRDFCENQVELITDVCGSVEKVFRQLDDLHCRTVLELQKRNTGTEFLWPFSNPAYLRDEKEIRVADFNGKFEDKRRYREYLAKKYGKRKMLFSGIHFNFSFDEEVLRREYEKKRNKTEYSDTFSHYKSSFYLELAAKMTKHSWLAVYLTAASPVMDGSFFCSDALGTDVLNRYASPRCSEIGYWNDFIPILRYENLKAYTDSIQAYINDGQLKSPAELYYPVRLKPRGENSLKNLQNNGVDHIELRMLDLNPLSSAGIFEEDLHFLHLLLVYLAFQEDDEFEIYEQIMAVKNEKRAARYNEKEIWIETGWSESVPVQDAALAVLQKMERFYQPFAEEKHKKSIELQKRKVLYARERYAVRIREQFHSGYVKQGIALVKQYAEEIAKKTRKGSENV